MNCSLFLPFLLTVVVLPLAEEKSWETLSFPEIPSNEISFAPGALQVTVEDSASALLHFFAETQWVTKIRIRGKVEGALHDAPTEQVKSPRDALLRVGLIEKGQRQMNPFQRIAAPQWLEDLEKRVLQRAEGIDCIHCYHLLPDRSSLGPMQEHPGTSFLRQKNHAAPDSEGNFDFLIEHEDPLPLIGLWLLADGDDTKSKFTITITKIEISRTAD